MCKEKKILTLPFLVNSLQSSAMHQITAAKKSLICFRDISNLNFNHLHQTYERTV